MGDSLRPSYSAAVAAVFPESADTGHRSSAKFDSFHHYFLIREVSIMIVPAPRLAAAHSPPATHPIQETERSPRHRTVQETLQGGTRLSVTPPGTAAPSRFGHDFSRVPV